MNTPSSQLLGLFDSEIQRIEAEQKKPGWTNWAIIGALGTISWLLSLELEKTHITWQLASFLLVVIFVVLDTLRDINRLFALTIGSTDVPRIFHLNEFGYYLRRSIAVDSAMYVFLIVAAFSISLSSLPYFKTACVLLFALRIVGAVISFALSYSSTPIPTKIKTQIEVPSHSISLILDLYLLASIVVALEGMQDKPSVPEVRLVVVLAVAFWLVRLLVESTSPHPLLGSLREIRRSYALGKIDDDSARRQFDRALTGMSVADYTVNEIVRRANQLERDLIDLNIDLARVRKLVHRKLSDDSEQLVKLLIRSCKDRLKATQSDIDEISKASKQFPFRIKVLNVITNLKINDITPLIDDMGDTLKGLTSSVQAVAATMHSLESNPRYKRIVDTLDNQIST